MQQLITYSKTTKHIINMATKAPSYNWDTQFDTANNTMTHTFSQRVQVVSNIKNGEASVKIDGNTVNAYYNMTVKEYEALLLAVEQHANQLEREGRLKSQLCKAVVYVLMGIGIFALMLLGGDNEEWSLGMFTAHKVYCIAVMAGCFLSVKHTPALAAAWQSIDKGIKE